jgi:CheY-like chemotaxis protein
MDGRILVVEDERIVQLDLCYEVERLGYIVVGMASSGEEAIAKAAQLEPDLILMDVRLKGSMDGIAAATRIRAARQVPVIYLTAQSQGQLNNEDQEPVHPYLAKPFQTGDLKAALSRALNAA